MQKGQKLSFDCQSCKKPVSFSLFEITKNVQPIICTHCEKKYLFKDETLLRHLKKFESLCTQIHECEEILANTSVGVDFREHQVKVPFKILLTRFTTYLDLIIGDENTPISFRFEPIVEMN